MKHNTSNYMNKHTIKSHITKVQRGVAYLLLISQLLTSCGEVVAASLVAESSEEPLSQPSAAGNLGSASSSLKEMPTDGAGANMQQQLRYLVGLGGEEKTIDVDLADTSVSDLLTAIKKQLNLTDCVFRLAVDKYVYKEDDTSALQSILDPGTLADTLVSIVKIPNTAVAQELLKNNYLGAEAWKKLGIKDSEAEAIEIPVLSDEMLVEIKWLQKNEQQPILFLDLGKSIEEIERLCTAKSITVLSTEYRGDEQLRAESYYKATGTDCPRWLLLPGSDHGVLPGSRDKNYDNQVKHMKANYRGYEVGGARELVTLAMLKYAQDGTVLFPGSPYTWGRCKEHYQTGDWKGYRICLGYVEASSSSGFGGLVVATIVDWHIPPIIPSSGWFVFFVS